MSKVRQNHLGLSRWALELHGPNGAQLLLERLSRDEFQRLADAVLREAQARAITDMENLRCTSQD